MLYSVLDLFPKGKLIQNAYPMSDLIINVVPSKCELEVLDQLMDMGWTIMATWLQDKDRSIVAYGIITDVSIRLGMEDERIIMVVDLPMGMAMDVVPNIDADIPGDKAEIITGMKNPLSKLRAGSISGYGPYATRGVGLKKPAKTPKFSTIGLDIEVTTLMRKDGMPLPHDPLISIAICNGGWYDKQFSDKCYLIHTFGYHRQVEWEHGRHPTIIKAENDEDAVKQAFDIITMLSPDFVNIHNGFNFDLRSLACASALDPITGETFEERRLGNVGVGVFWMLMNGTIIVDSMYTADKVSRSEWNSFALNKMCKKFDLPEKLDSGTMKVVVSEQTDVTDILVYNARDSDMHAWLAKEMKMCERIALLAGCSRSTLWDSVANNTGVMTFCMIQSVALSRGEMLDLGRNSMNTDDQKFEGGYVVPPRPGCYRGVIMIDGNSLYGSLMSKLQIFIDRCASASTPTALQEKVDVPLPEEVHEMPKDDAVWNDNVIVLRTKRTYIAVVQRGPTLLSDIIERLISLRKEAKAKGDDVTSWTFKILLVSIYGALGSSHGVMASKVCAEATTASGRYFVRNMIRVARECGYEVIYGDTDSIFVLIGSDTEEECMKAGEELKQAIDKSMVGTPFAQIGADIKGNYKMMLITARKKYTVVEWNGEMETKGMTPVKKDTLPIARYAATKVLNMIMSDSSFEDRKKMVTMFLGKLFNAVEKKIITPDLVVTETKINCQPHFKYKDAKKGWVSRLVDSGLEDIDVDKEWVKDRIVGAIKTILEAGELGSVRELMFSYNNYITIAKRKTKNKASESNASSNK